MALGHEIKKVLGTYYHLMQLTPDASHWGRDTKIIKPLLETNKTGVRAFTGEQLADCLEELTRRKISIRSIGVLKIAGLVASFVDEDAEEFERIVKYLGGRTSGPQRPKLVFV